MLSFNYLFILSKRKLFSYFLKKMLAPVETVRSYEYYVLKEFKTVSYLSLLSGIYDNLN